MFCKMDVAIRNLIIGESLFQPLVQISAVKHVSIHDQIRPAEHPE